VPYEIDNSSLIGPFKNLTNINIRMQMQQ